MTKYVTGYGRISVDLFGAGEGVENMKFWFEAWARSAHPGRPTRWFEDNDISGSKSNRDGFVDLQRAIRAGEVEELWFRDVTRLQREKDIWFGPEGLQKLLIRNGLIYVYSFDRGAREGATWESGRVPVDDMVTDIEAVVGHHRRKEDRKHLMERQERDAYKGYPPNGAIFGYRHVQTTNGDGRKIRTLEIVPEQAELIRWAAAEVLAGRTASSISRDKRLRGVRGAKGGQVHGHPQAIDSWLTNATVAGFRRYQGEIVRDEEGRRISGNWEPILDVATWEEVGAILSHQQLNKQSNRGGEARRRYILSGLCHCTSCDRTMVGWRYTPKADANWYYYYKCRICGTIVSMPVVDGLALDLVGQRLAELVELNEELVTDPHAHRRDEIHRSLEGMQTMRAEAKEDWLGGLETREGYQDTLRRIKQREEALQAELAQLVVPSSQDDPEAALKAFLTARADAAGGDAQAIETLRYVASEWITRINVTPSQRRRQPPEERIEIVGANDNGTRYDVAS